MQCFQDTSIMIQTTTLLLDFIFSVMVGRMVWASLGTSGWYTLNKLRGATKETLNCTDQLAKLATRVTGLSANWDSASEADSETLCLSVWWWNVCQLCLFALILTESLLQCHAVVFLEQCKPSVWLQSSLMEVPSFSSSLRKINCYQKKSFTVPDSRNNCIRLKNIDHIKKSLNGLKNKKERKDLPYYYEALRSLTKPKMKTDTSCLFT